MTTNTRSKGRMRAYFGLPPKEVLSDAEVEIVQVSPEYVDTPLYAFTLARLGPLPTFEECTPKQKVALKKSAAK